MVRCRVFCAQERKRAQHPDRIPEMLGAGGINAVASTNQKNKKVDSLCPTGRTPGRRFL